MKKKFIYNLEWNNVGSGDQRSDCTFCAVWSWSTLSTKGSCVVNNKEIVIFCNLSTDGSVVSVSYSWPCGCEFDIRLRRTLFPAYFRLSPLLKNVRKVVGGVKPWNIQSYSNGIENIFANVLWYGKAASSLRGILCRKTSNTNHRKQWKDSNSVALLMVSFKNCIIQTKTWITKIFARLRRWQKLKIMD